MSLIALATFAAVATAAGYWAARRRARAAAPSPIAQSPDARPQADRFAGMPFAIGDVVTVEGADRWLSGAAVALERDAVIAALFFAPEGAADSAVLAQPAPERSILWLEPARAVATPDEPPATLEIDRATFVRRRRIPVRIERVGHGVPELDDAALWAIYEGTGRSVAVVVASGAHALAWKGSRYLEGEYDVLGPGGG